MQSKATTISASTRPLRRLKRVTCPHPSDRPQKRSRPCNTGLPAFGDLCALASQKNYMALYVCESDLVKAHFAQLGKVSCGKGCIRFKRLTDLNLSTVERLLREVLKLRKAGIGPSGRT